MMSLGHKVLTLKCIIFEHMLQIKFMDTSGQIVRRWMPQNIFDDMSKLVQIMASDNVVPEPMLTHIYVPIFKIQIKKLKKKVIATNTLIYMVISLDHNKLTTCTIKPLI